MNKLFKHLKHSVLIILGGLIVPALLSVIFNGFIVNVVSIVNYEFFIGIIIATIGGILITFDFNQFKKKVLKTPMDVKVSENEDSGKINWPYTLFFSGVVIVIAAFALGEIL